MHKKYNIQGLLDLNDINNKNDLLDLENMKNCIKEIKITKNLDEPNLKVICES